MICRLAALLLASLALSNDRPAPGPKGPLSPEDERRALVVDPGLRVELVASEPRIESPVAIAFDEHARLWVVEMRDYPNGPAPGDAPGGRIKVLEDRDGDGHYEAARVFADGLLFANGVLPWKDGAIVTQAPNVVWLRDTDGDGRADVREVLYEGFTAGNPQLRVSFPTLGPDGWIYVANGLRGGKVRRAGRDDAPLIDLGGRDFRFDLVRDRHEAIAGMGQYGNTFDDRGHRFVCTNRNHLVPIVLEDRHARRNPDLAPPSANADNQKAGGAAKIFPLSRGFTTSSLHLGTFSAACGVTVYRGSLLPASYRGSAFTCDPTGNLVHQEWIEADGAGFLGRRAREGVEFLASPDEWFRPVSLAQGPDGGLYVVDMDRAVIEHPEFMPAELKTRPDLTLGRDRGRIWRIVPEGPRDRPAPPNLSRASTADLVKTLAHPDSWWQTTAQRILLQRDDPTAVGPLRSLAADRGALPQGRILAAWLLDRRGSLDDELLGALLDAEDPGVREHGLILAEGRLASRPSLDRVIALSADPDARVRYQAAASLGTIDDDRILDPLARIALRGASDRWTRLIVASAVPGRAGALIARLIRGPGPIADRTDPDRLTLLRELSGLVGSRRDPAEVASTLKALGVIGGPDAGQWRLAALNGLADGAGRRGTRLADLLAKLLDTEASARAEAALAEAARAATDPEVAPSIRLDATRLLAHVRPDEAMPALARLIDREPAQDLRITAIRSLAGHDGPDVPSRLLAAWPGATPAVRREIAQALLSRPDRCLALLASIEDGRLRANDLDSVQARRLAEHRDPAVREKAASLLAVPTPAERLAALDRYKIAIESAGDPRRGREVFRKACATCHRVDNLGIDVGPDIGDARTKTKAMLLGDILNPNAAIDGNFVAYTVLTRDGRVLGGLIAEDSPASLTLKRAEGQVETVARVDIEELRSTGVSLMPEGLEKDIPVAEMTDLLEFLKGWRYMDGAVPVPPGGIR